MRHYWLIILISGLCLGGCGGGAKIHPPEQLVSQAQDKAKKQGLQEQLLAQVSRLTLANYKDYTAGPEDLLEVVFLGQDELYREIRVNGRGEITMPLVGAVSVVGLSPPQIEARLGRLYKKGRFIRDPQITVFVKEYRYQRVMVTGAVAAPGSHEVIGPRTLLEMLGKAGGLNEKAGEVVYIIRRQSAPDMTKTMKAAPAQPLAPGSETIVVDLRRLLIEGALELNLPIQNGDVIHVPFARHAYVLGAVKKPGQVPVKDKVTVTQALAVTEGIDQMLGSHNVTLLRFDDKGERLVIPINLTQVVKGAEPDPLLKDNDIVFVAESPIKRFLFNVRNLMPGSFSAGYTLIP